MREEQQEKWTLGSGLSIIILIFLALLMHQTIIGFFMDGAIAFFAAKYYIDKNGDSEEKVLIAIGIFLVVLLTSAFVLGFISRNLLGQIF